MFPRPLSVSIAVTLSLLASRSLVSAAEPAKPATSSGIIPVTATALNACIVAATPLAFGTLVQLTGSTNDSTAAITVTCTPGTNYSVGLDQGIHASGGVRHMEGAVSASRVPYTLYSNPGRTVTWGNTVGTDTVAGTAVLLPSIFTVYGRIPANATIGAADIYADVVTVTVTF